MNPARLTFHRRPHRRGRGFTLIEMMMALTIFILLAGAVFGIMTGVLQGTATLQDSQAHRDVVDALDLFLKQQFSSIPPSGSLTSYIRGDGDGLDQTGVIYGTGAQATAIDAIRQPNGYYTLRLTTYVSTYVNGTLPDARQTLQIMVSNNDPELAWTPLVKDLKDLSWKFEDQNATQWADLWIGNGKPSFIEFSVLPAGDLVAAKMDYWLPKVDPISLNIPPPPTNAP